jgi:hypothetical protein
LRSTIKTAAFLVLISIMPILLQAESELPLNHKRLSEKVLVVWIGDYMQSIATVALATEKGIVVIEASLIRKNDARIRRVIEKEFGRNDFKYLINTIMTTRQAIRFTPMQQSLPTRTSQPV